MIISLKGKISVDFIRSYTKFQIFNKYLQNKFFYKVLYKNIYSIYTINKNITYLQVNFLKNSYYL